MSDRELLDLAAKAAGLKPSESDGVIYAGFGSMEWDPLADDGDALRLAVKLHISARSHGPNHWQRPNISVAIWDIGETGGRVEIEHGDDDSRATRRAIVLAAASIGKAMK